MHQQHPSSPPSQSQSGKLRLRVKTSNGLKFLFAARRVDTVDELSLELKRTINEFLNDKTHKYYNPAEKASSVKDIELNGFALHRQGVLHELLGDGEEIECHVETSKVHQNNNNHSGPAKSENRPDKKDLKQDKAKGKQHEKKNNQQRIQDKKKNGQHNENTSPNKKQHTQNKSQEKPQHPKQQNGQKTAKEEEAKNNPKAQQKSTQNKAEKPEKKKPNNSNTEGEKQKKAHVDVEAILAAMKNSDAEETQKKTASPPKTIQNNPPKNPQNVPQNSSQNISQKPKKVVPKPDSDEEN